VLHIPLLPIFLLLSSQYTKRWTASIIKLPITQFYSTPPPPTFPLCYVQIFFPAPCNKTASIIRNCYPIVSYDKTLLSFDVERQSSLS
jgi:hypothetical protein